MSTATSARPENPPKRAGRLSAVRRYAPWVLLLVVATVITLLLTSPRAEEDLHPRNNGPNGAQALAQVLAQQGVEVEFVTGSRSLGAEDVGPGTTVLLPHTAYLGPQSGPALLASLAEATRLVVLVPSPELEVGATLGIDLSTTWAAGQRLVADCADPITSEGDLLSTSDVLLAAGGSERTEVLACYPPGPGHNAGGAREGAMLTFPATATRPVTTVFGAASTWTNARVTQEANAALALRLLGGGDRLLWVLPEPADAALDAPASLWDVLPGNLTAAVVLLAAAVGALALQQGRRLGPVVSEPLPALVRATETTTSRGRLYRQARDRGHALRAVQAGARRRIAPLLGLPRTVDPERLVGAVGTAAGLPEGQVRALLVDPGGPVDDAAFLDQVRAIRGLEDRLAHPDRPTISTEPTTERTP